MSVNFVVYMLADILELLYAKSKERKAFLLLPCF